MACKKAKKLRGNMMERVAVVMGKMHSGGKKNLVMEYYRNIDKSKIQFDFLCDTDSNAIPQEEIEKMGGRVYKIAPYQNIFKNMSQMKAICKKNNYRIMHSYNGTMNLFSMFIGWQCGIPIRISESISMAHSADKKTILKNILKPFSKMFATDFMANGEACGRWQFGDKAFNEGKVLVFKTVINTDANKYDEELRNITRKKYGIEENIVVGHIGRLTEQKNTLFIIDVFNALVKKEPKAMLLIIGDGNLKEDMLRRIDEYGIKDKVLYLGRREDIAQFYDAMDVFLLPSLYEGLPVVGIEAQAYGLPIVFSTEIPRESSVCDDIGYFFNLDMPIDAWADKTLEIANKNIPMRKGRQSEIQEAGYDSKEEGKKLTEYYLRLLERANR